MTFLKHMKLVCMTLAIMTLATIVFVMFFKKYAEVDVTPTLNDTEFPPFNKSKASNPRYSFTFTDSNNRTLYASNVTVDKLANFDGFQLLIDADVCGDDDVYMLIIIASHPNNVKMRKLLRKTLGQPEIDGKVYRVLFPFGNVTHDVEKQKQLEEESEKYGDVIQGNFVDDYRNVTLRDLMALRWAWQRCPQAKYVMHMDDDVTVDIYKLEDVIERQYEQLTKTVGCFFLYVGWSVFREGRYGVSREDHPEDIYEPYCLGWLYVTTPAAAFRLDMASLRVKYYWMNDAYITGTLVKAIGSEIHDLKVTYALEKNNSMTSSKTWPPKYVIGPTEGDVKLMMTLFMQYRARYFVEKRYNVTVEP